MEPLGEEAPVPMPPRMGSAARAIVALRLSLGVIWAFNLVYIVAPASQFFPTFPSTAETFGPTTLGGPAVASFAAAHPAVFAGLVAFATAYLAVAFLLGLTTRVACLVGGVFNLVLLLTQFGSLTIFPGSTDVGPQPLYLAMYIVLAVGYADAPLSVDRWLSRRTSAARATRSNGTPSPRVSASPPNPGHA